MLTKNSNPVVGPLNFLPKSTTEGVYTPIETTGIIAFFSAIVGWFFGQKTTEAIYVEKENARTLKELKASGDVKLTLGFARKA